MKRAIITAVIIAATLIAGSVSAASGSTSTGSTSTGTVSTGSVSSCNNCGAGGPVRAWNYTIGGFDMYPQCFPWVFRTDYLKGNIFDMYKNQEACRAQRLIDFKF